MISQQTGFILAIIFAIHVGYLFDLYISTLNTEGRDFVTVLESYTTSTVSWIYYVENSECKESSASGIGSFSKCDYAKGYCVSLGAYDAMYEYEEGKDLAKLQFRRHLF